LSREIVQRGEGKGPWETSRLNGVEKLCTGGGGGLTPSNRKLLFSFVTTGKVEGAFSGGSFWEGGKTPKGGGEREGECRHAVSGSLNGRKGKGLYRGEKKKSGKGQLKRGP